MKDKETHLQLQNLPRSDSFCVLPWIHLCGSVDGVWGRCCVDTTMYHEHLYLQDKRPYFTLKEDAIGCTRQSEYAKDNKAKIFSVDQAFNSPAIKKTRLAMLNGESVDACVYCYERERCGGESYRIKMKKLFETDAELAARIKGTNADGSITEFPTYLDIRFGNHCNLACTMCAFPTSSRLAKEKGPSWSKARIDPYTNDDELWIILQQNINTVRRVYFAGGEPFLQPSHFRLLDLFIKVGTAHQVALTYNSNLTILPPRVLEVFPRFKSVEIGASCDGYKDVYERIRQGASWSRFVSNLSKARQFCRVSLAVTPQRGNIYDIPKLIDWALSEGYEVDLTNFLHYPEEMSIRSSSSEERLAVTELYEELAKQYINIHPALSRQLTMVANFASV